MPLFSTRLTFLFSKIATYCFIDKALKETFDKILLSGYFDRTQTHQNGVCEEEEEQQPAPAESSESEEQPAEPGMNPLLCVPLECLFVNF